MRSRIETSVQARPRQKKRNLLLAFGLALSLAVGCTKAPPHPDIAKLQKQLRTGEKRLEDMELEIKSSKGDPAMAAELGEERRLLESRIERIREMLAALGAPVLTEDAGSGH